MTNDPGLSRFTLILNMVVKAPDAAVTGTKAGSFIIGPTTSWSARAPKGTPATGVLTLTNISGKPVKITGLSTAGRAVSSSFNMLEEGKRYAVNLASSSELTVGTHRDTLIIRTDDKETPELKVPIEITVIPAVMTSPSNLEFDLTSLKGEEGELKGINKFLWLRLARGNGIEVTSIKCDLPFIQAKINSKDGHSIVLRVGFSARPPAGNYFGTLQVVTNIDSAGTIEVPIKVIAK